MPSLSVRAVPPAKLTRGWRSGLPSRVAWLGASQRAERLLKKHPKLMRVKERAWQLTR